MSQIYFRTSLKILKMWIKARWTYLGSSASSGILRFQVICQIESRFQTLKRILRLRRQAKLLTRCLLENWLSLNLLLTIFKKRRVSIFSSSKICKTMVESKYFKTCSHSVTPLGSISRTRLSESKTSRNSPQS